MQIGILGNDALLIKSLELTGPEGKIVIKNHDRVWLSGNADEGVPAVRFCVGDKVIVPY